MNKDVSQPATLLDAVNLALANAMAEDESVIMLGEDVGQNGGVFRATDGLQQRFGSRRVLDTPLAETTIAGLGVGLASQGLKPVLEIQFLGFIYAAMEQLISHAARLRNRTRSRLSCPLVVRAPFGGGIHAPEHHSESTEALLAHIPGLRVVVPSSPARAYGLLLAAIRDPDPVIFLEPKRIYRSHKQLIDDDGIALPLDSCFTLKQGSDISVVSWGAAVSDVLEAAESLLADGISVEVIDVGTLKPLDMQSILNSVQKTGRLVIVQEAALSGGVASDIAANIAEHALLLLQAPIARVTGYDTPMPYFKNENSYMPQVADIVMAIKETLEYV